MGNIQIKDEIKKLYQLYGFKSLEDKPEILTFIYDQGYFKNAEIIRFSDTSVETYRNELLSIGFNAQVTSFPGIEELRNRLFKGFFKVNYYRDKVRKEYQNFKENQKKLLGVEYEYIKGNYYNGVNLKHDDLIQNILTELGKEGPRLIVLEAAAGYGKTCTVYEIFNEIANQLGRENIPLMSELSRNRKAKIFRYILLDEIDKNFPGLNSELVESEIYNGKIPLIVDGFDELLIRSHSTPNIDSSNDFDDIESMLGTIGDMLKGNAKIILTSRKSALLSGDKFYEWINSRENDFHVSRYTLNEPSVRDWLGPEKASIIYNFGNDAGQLLNPVMLAFIKSLSVSELSNSNIDDLINDYFHRLLSREKVRQNIKLESDEQMEIFEGLSYKLALTGITSDTRESIKNMIFENYWTLIDKTRERYYGSDKPDVESIANTLAGHVLLDRNGSSDEVGFINEFIFGVLVGNSICKYKSREYIDMKFVDLACTSYEIRAQEKKDALFQEISLISEAFLDYEKLEVDKKLKNCMTSNYNELSLNGTVLNNFQFKGYSVRDSVFFSCVFSNMTFQKSVFLRTSFIDCKFYNCVFDNDTEHNHEIHFINCNSDDDNSTFLSDSNDDESLFENEGTSHEVYEKIVIEKFWPAGKAAAQQKRAYRTLFYGIEHSDHIHIEKAIDRLKKRGILRVFSDIYILEFSKMSEIQKIKNGNRD